MTEPMPELEVAEAGGGRDFLHDRRALALIGAAVVAVGAAGYFVVLPMLGGSSSTPTGLVAHGQVHTSASPSVTPSPTAGPATAAPALAVRDPFSPLYAAPAADNGGGGSGAVGGGAPGAGGITVPVQSSSAPSPLDGGAAQTYVVQELGSTTTVTTTAKPTQAAPKYTLTLTKVIDASHVSVTINGKPYTVARGGDVPDAKRGPFQLTSVAVGGPAQFMYGDATFAMSVGETQAEN